MHCDTSGLKPVVAISSCLLGESVRYDGGHKKQSELSEFLRANCQVVSICPEMMMGLGVPRAPIQIVHDQKRVHLRTVSPPHENLTQLARKTAQRVLGDISLVAGWIFKARSPSCGLTDTPVFNREGKQVALGSGMFSASILEDMPWLPCVDESQLQQPESWPRFMQQVSIMQQVNAWLMGNRSDQTLFEMELSIRSLLGNVPHTKLQELSSGIRNQNKSIDERFYHYRQKIMLLAKSS